MTHDHDICNGVCFTCTRKDVCFPDDPEKIFEVDFSKLEKRLLEEFSEKIHSILASRAEKLAKSRQSSAEAKSWIGLYGFFSDKDPTCSDHTIMRQLRAYDEKASHPFILSGTTARYFKPMLLANPNILWECLPEQAEWIAMDKEGRWRWFSKKPIENPYYPGSWVSWEGVSAAISLSKTLLPKVSSWKESLSRRPEK